jgi:hypothetical protein
MKRKVEVQTYRCPVRTSVADPGSLFLIPDPDIYPSRIPDPTATKKGGEKNLLSYLFVWPKKDKIKN